MSIMATQCTASAKMALPSLLRSVFYPEFTCNLRASSLRQDSRPTAKLQQLRPFSSTARAYQIQIKQSQHATTTLATPQSSSFSTPSSPSSATEPTTNPDSPPHETAPVSSTKREKTSRGSSKKDGKERKGLSKDRKFDSAKKIPWKKTKPDPWQTQKDALEKKFPTGWNPPKKLSPDALEGIRHLHATAPERFTTSVLAEEFKVSPEAIRRILKSRWRPSEAETESRRQRWEKRHERIWSRMAELGLRPSTKASRPYSDAKTLYKPGEGEF
ncbi:Required for respiratory growth protein 9 [Penicillium canariense]|uniref:Required for respiratory growth protein 9, mitochondrial n=1 Tax=Penicillium canariense TaxID=189055 RepID=A0A9W9IGJ4_9EURO|nr:Required for respiratory growth protein 9 [Penicillium canariense]KAJ5175859.1 Required for respiratory growth protein 9 [Penicillium canariense]